jgi:YidC/Oxa1 family membrane protein insertase
VGSIFNFVDVPVAWVITQIYNVLGPVFGPASGATWVLSIVVLVILMRLIMVPLFIKQMHTQRAMTALTPRLTELRKKYKGDRETLNQETMKLYQEAGVNPLMGCLPVVLQMPIFFALFSVLRQIADWHPGQPGGLKYHLTVPMVENAHKAKIFGATIADKFFAHGPVHVKIVIGAAVLLSMTTTYLTMRQSMKRGMMPTGSDNPMGQSQKLMVYIMPFFALTGLIWPFGLVMYWVTTNLWTLGQQYVLLRRYPVGAAAMGPDGNKPMPGRPAAGGIGGRLTGGTGGGTGGRTGGGSGGRAAGGDRGGKAGAGGARSGGSRPADAKPGAISDRPPADGSATANGKAAAGGRQAPGAGAGGQGRRSGGSRPAGSAGSGGSAGQAGGGKPKRTGQPGGRPRVPGDVNGGSPNGNGAVPDGGLLRRLGKGRAEPEPPAAAEPEIKLVRQQRQRQSRSKRSGKR